MLQGLFAMIINSPPYVGSWIRLADIRLADSGWARLALSAPFFVWPFINPVPKLLKQYIRLQGFSIHRHAKQFFVEEFRVNRKNKWLIFRFSAKCNARHVKSSFSRYNRNSQSESRCTRATPEILWLPVVVHGKSTRCFYYSMHFFLVMELRY